MKIRLNRKEGVYECCKCGRTLNLEDNFFHLRHPVKCWGSTWVIEDIECEFKGRLFCNPDVRVVEEVIEDNP